MTRRLAVSFSGGETSALMTINILKHMKEKYEKIKDTFLEYHDENQVYDSEMDQPGGCGNESCEFMTQENEDDV